jgi:hypothetical protein
MDKLEAKINSQGSLTEFCLQLVDFWREHKWITVVVYAKRTLDQNRAIRECYKQIRMNTDGWTAKYIERLCKLQYGVPILSENQVDAWVFNRVLKPLNFEQRLKVMDTFAVTSKMTPEQANQFITSLIDDFQFIALDKNKKGRYV